MPGMRRRDVLVGLMAAGAALGGAPGGAPRGAWAQTDWPNRPVRAIVPYPPGATTDWIMRALVERLSRQLGQQFVIEHKGGAVGTIGTEAVARATPDGYTMLLSPQAPIQVLPHLRKLAYDSLKDFVTVGRMGEAVAGFAVHPSVGVKTLPEFIALAKKNPGKYTYATAGVGSMNHLRGETLKLMAGIDLLHVPYKGVGEALPDLLSGVVSSMFDASVFPHVKGGKLFMVATLADERHPDFPDVKTVKEQGFPDFDVPIWFGAYPPAGTPPPIIEKLHAAIATIHGDEAFRAQQMTGGVAVYKQALSLPQLRERVAQQYNQFGDLAKRANIRLD